LLDRSKGRRQTKRDTKTDAGSSVNSSGLKHRANDAQDGSISYSNRRDQSGLNGYHTAMWKQMEKLPHYHFSLIVSFQKQSYHICEMLPLETKLYGCKLLPQSDLRGGVFLEEMSCRYDKKVCKEQKEHHSYKIGTWNVRTLNQGGKLENLKTETQKNEMSVLGISEVRWKGQGEISSGDFTMYYSGGERAERGVAIVVHKNTVRSVVKKVVCNVRIIALKLQAEPVSILIMQMYVPTSEYEDDEVEKL